MVKNKTKKAYQITSKYDDDIFIVFAESAEKAKAETVGEFDMNTKFIDLTAERLPDADFFVERNPALWKLEWENPEHQKWLRINLGWQTLDDEEYFSCRTCKKLAKCFEQCTNCASDCLKCDFYSDLSTEICEEYEEIQRK